MSVTFPLGFLASGVNCGLKEKEKDIALVINKGPKFDATAVFTSNQVKAAPVLWSMEVLKSLKQLDFSRGYKTQPFFTEAFLLGKREIKQV